MGDSPTCGECGGEMVPGAISLPLLGTAKFEYRLGGGASVDTEIDGQMCLACGLVVFRGRDPGRIRRAHESLNRALRR
jgi:hypothetical protein